MNCEQLIRKHSMREIKKTYIEKSGFLRIIKRHPDALRNTLKCIY